MSNDKREVLKSATKHTLEVVEFDRIRQLISDMCFSEMGKETALALEPLPYIELVRERLVLIEEITRASDESGQPDLTGIYDMRNQVILASKEGILDPVELWKIALVSELSNKLVRFGQKGCRDKQLLADLLSGLHEINNIPARIKEFIVPPGELSEDATPLLTELRKRKTIVHERIRTKLDSYISSPVWKKVLQEELITLRNSRFVLPVKIEHKADIPGVIHDRSDSGATLFIEPLTVVDLNNELRELELTEKAERERILRILTELVAAQAGELTNNIGILGRLDFLVACSRMAKRFDAVCPSYGESGDLVIVGGRHPLLLIEAEEKEGFEVVPLDLELLGDKKALVITGPNMGGKTVALKTCGMLAAMAQCGLPIPAEEGSKIPHFSAIFSDIGDEQSIDDSLSSFASHVKRWMEAIESSDKNSLIILDELGSATDPEEGTPLSLALIEEFLDRGSYLIVTTHLGGLKVLASSSKGIDNGAMEFDEEKLEPTYRLLSGIPGRSWAFQVARRLGLPERILKRGERIAGDSGVTVDSLIGDLQKKVREAESLRKKAEAETKAIKEEKETLNLLIAANREKAQHIEELRKSYEDDRLDMLEKELAVERRKLSEELRKFRKEQELIESARDMVKTRIEEIKTQQVKRRGAPVQHKPGDRVWLYRMKKHGVVVQENDANGYIIVEVDGTRIKLHSSAALAPKENQPQESTDRRPFNRGIRYERPNVPLAKDIRGMNFEEAWKIVDRWIDDSVVVGLRSVTLIHGKGTGALREKLRDILSIDKRIKGWGEADLSEGGEGATIIILPERQTRPKEPPAGTPEKKEPENK